MKYINLLTVTTIFLTAVPSVVASQKITEIELKTNKEGLELRLEGDKDNDLPSFITVDKGNTLEATILNTELNIDREFQQTNPASGIEKITLERIDEEHTKITLIKEADLTLESNIQQQDSELIVSFKPEEVDNSLINKLPFSSEIKSFKNQVASLVTNKNKNDDEKEETKVSDNNQNNDVLVPNPEIIITNPSDGLNDSQENSYEQPYLPRAVAPPVGDMAVSNINASPDTVDLESSAIVPRLVLRDASVREVLSLLARQAGLNIVFTLGEGGAEGSEEGNNVVEGPTVSLDLENQTVQEAFDSILLISGLSASRRGNTIYIGNNLPIQARNVISRTIRLNQVQAANAALFLATQGAQGQRLTTEIEETVDPETGRVVQRRELPASLESLGGAAEEEDAGNAFLLQGLLIATDDRLNSITLVGEARKVEIATAFLTQLDARRPQVAVNIKVIDINLLNQENFNSSFSFGINDTYFQQDNGSAILNFGGENPTLGTTVTRRPRGNETTEYEQLPDPPFREIEIPTPGDLPKRFLALIQSQVVSGNAKILTDPTLVVQEGQEGTVKLVQDVIQRVEVQIDGDSGLRTIEPILAEAGLSLTVNVERIDDNGFINLSVSPVITSIGGTQNFDSGAAVNTLSLLTRRELSSGLIRLRDSQTLVLSGIIQDQERTTVTKVPILGDIPLLGSLFRSTNNSNERAEVIVLLTPEIIDEQADFGYNYQPSKDTREMLREGGSDLPNNPEQ